MLCDNCSNKSICKYLAFFVDAPMIINIESCDHYVAKFKPIENKVYSNPNDNMTLLKFKEPIDYSQFDMTQNVQTVNDEDEENEERITVDLTNDVSIKEPSITDLLLGDDE